MARTAKQALREDTAEILLNALDDARHKLIEQGYFGQEQTGYLQSPYGSTWDDAGDWWNGSGNNTETQQTSAQTDAPQDETNNADWWHGSHSTATDTQHNQNYQPEEDGQAWSQEM